MLVVALSFVIPPESSEWKLTLQDLISYEVEGVDPLTVHEVAEGIGKCCTITCDPKRNVVDCNRLLGDLCGGIFVDEAFESVCKNRLGRGWDRLSKVGIREVMKGEWEHAIKPQFKVSNSKREYIVSIPAEAFPNKDSQTDTSRQPFIKRGRIHFKEYDHKSLFPVLY